MKRILLALALVTSQAHAGLYVTGDKLNAWSHSVDRIHSGTQRNDDYANAANFHGYLWGVLDAYEGVLLCLPETTATSQVAAIVQQYLNAHPEMWGSDGAVIVHAALKPVFPCKK